MEHLGHAGGIVLVVIMHLADRVQEENFRLMPRDNIAQQLKPRRVRKVNIRLAGNNLNVIRNLKLSLIMIHLSTALDHAILLELMFNQQHMRLLRHRHFRVIKGSRAVRKPPSKLQHDHGFADARAPAEDHLRAFRQHVSADPELILRNAFFNEACERNGLKPRFAEDHKLTPRPPSGSLTP